MPKVSAAVIPIQFSDPRAVLGTSTMTKVQIDLMKVRHHQQTDEPLDLSYSEIRRLEKKKFIYVYRDYKTTVEYCGKSRPLIIAVTLTYKGLSELAGYI